MNIPTTNTLLILSSIEEHIKNLIIIILIHTTLRDKGVGAKEHE